MGLLSRFRKQKTSPPESPKEEEIIWHSNAPSHWPTLRTAPLPSMGGGHPAMDTLFFSARLAQAFDGFEESFTLLAVAQNCLTSDGLLELPIIVQVGDKKHPLFFFPDASQNSAAHFSAAHEVLANRPYDEPIYFAPDELKTAPPAASWNPFSFHDFSKPERDHPEGSYSMWWSSDENGDWETSPCRATIDRYYESMDRIETYVLGMLVRQLGDSEEISRQALPEDLVEIPLMGPENMPIVMSASQEKGLRLHFNPELTSAEYRDNFWKLFADAIHGMRESILKNKLPLDHESDERPVHWWRLTSKAALEIASEKGIERLGTLSLDPTQDESGDPSPGVQTGVVEAFAIAEKWLSQQDELLFLYYCDEGKKAFSPIENCETQEEVFATVMQWASSSETLSWFVQVSCGMVGADATDINALLGHCAERDDDKAYLMMQSLKRDEATGRLVPDGEVRRMNALENVFFSGLPDA